MNDKRAPFILSGLALQPSLMPIDHNLITNGQTHARSFAQVIETAQGFNPIFNRRRVLWV